MFIQLEPFRVGGFTSAEYYVFINYDPRCVELIKTENFANMCVVKDDKDEAHILVADKKFNYAFSVSSKIINAKILIELTDSMIDHIIKRGFSTTPITIGSIQYEWIGRWCYIAPVITAQMFMSINYVTMKIHYYIHGHRYTTTSFNGKIAPPINPRIEFMSNHKLAIKWAGEVLMAPEQFYHQKFYEWDTTYQIDKLYIHVFHHPSPTTIFKLRFEYGKDFPINITEFTVSDKCMYLGACTTAIVYNPEELKLIVKRGLLANPEKIKFTPAIFIGYAPVADCLIFSNGAFNQKFIIISKRTGKVFNFDSQTIGDFIMNEIHYEMYKRPNDVFIHGDSAFKLSLDFCREKSKLIYTPYHL